MKIISAAFIRSVRSKWGSGTRRSRYRMRWRTGRCWEVSCVALESTFIPFILDCVFTLFLGVTTRWRDARCHRRWRDGLARTRKLVKQRVSTQFVLTSENKEGGHTSAESSDEVPSSAPSDAACTRNLLSITLSATACDAEIMACLSHLERTERTTAVEKIFVRTPTCSPTSLQYQVGVNEADDEPSRSAIVDPPCEDPPRRTVADRGPAW